MKGRPRPDSHPQMAQPQSSGALPALVAHWRAVACRAAGVRSYPVREPLLQHLVSIAFSGCFAGLSESVCVLSC